MNSRREHRFGEKKRQRPGETNSGICHPDQYFGGNQVGIHDHRGSGALICQFEVFNILGKGEIACLSAVRRRKTGQQRRGITDDFALEMLGNFSSGKRHIQ
jgi:hypothetical protein